MRDHRNDPLSDVLAQALQEALESSEPAPEYLWTATCDGMSRFSLPFRGRVGEGAAHPPLDVSVRTDRKGKLHGRNEKVDKTKTDCEGDGVCIAVGRAQVGSTGR